MTRMAACPAVRHPVVSRSLSYARVLLGLKSGTPQYFAKFRRASLNSAVALPGCFPVREGLIYSRLYSAICSWAGPQGQFDGHPLVREPCSGIYPPSDRPRPTPDTRPLCPRQELSTCHMRIRQATTDIQPVGILRESSVPKLGPPEDPLDHQEHMFDLRPDFRLRAVPSPLGFTQGR
jgi:hypothetical protein